MRERDVLLLYIVSLLRRTDDDRKRGAKKNTPTTKARGSRPEHTVCRCPAPSLLVDLKSNGCRMRAPLFPPEHPPTHTLFCTVLFSSLVLCGAETTDPEEEEVKQRIRAPQSVPSPPLLLPPVPSPGHSRTVQEQLSAFSVAFMQPLPQAQTGFRAPWTHIHTRTRTHTHTHRHTYTHTHRERERDCGRRTTVSLGRSDRQKDRDDGKFAAQRGEREREREREREQAVMTPCSDVCVGHHRPPIVAGLGSRRGCCDWGIGECGCCSRGWSVHLHAHCCSWWRRHSRGTCGCRSWLVLGRFGGIGRGGRGTVSAAPTVAASGCRVTVGRCRC